MKAFFQLILSMLIAISFAYILSASAGSKIDSALPKAAGLTIVNKGSTLEVLNTNLQLQALLPEGLKITDNHIHWTVSRQEAVIKEVRGRTQALKLPEGRYRVKLTIGKFTADKEVSVLDGKHIQPYFKADVARLQLSANQVVDWSLMKSEQRHFILKQRDQLDELLPAGNYTVKAILRDTPLQQKVRLEAGQTLKKEIHIPIGRVRLVATKDNQPLFRPMLWKVYRLDKEHRQQVGKYHLHSKSISIPPGLYEAVAEHNDIVRKRQFWVQKDTTNKVILGMD